LKILVLVLALLQFGPPALSELGIAQRDARRVEGLTPAETLLEPELLRTIERASVEGRGIEPPVILGTDKAAGEIALACSPKQCEAVEWAIKRIWQAIASKVAPPPSRTIRFDTLVNRSSNTKAVIMITASEGRGWEIVRGPWSTAGIGDEVVELFARHAVGDFAARPFADVGQPKWDWLGVPTTTIVMPADATGLDRASFIAAASAYYLATLPNAGAEALLSHLTVGAHARLAEDGRRAVAQMGNQQRASADVLIMFGQAIEREQRRMRSFESFMPAPVDPMLRSRIADMEKGITSVWTSMGITSSPFVPAAERIRGRAGEDRRIPSRIGTDRIRGVEPPTAFLKFPSPADVLFELHNFIDGKRSISDIRDAVSAEFGPLPLPSVTDYFDRLAASGAITIRKSGA
jgi:hypothetical protein